MAIGAAGTAEHYENLSKEMTTDTARKRRLMDGAQQHTIHALRWKVEHLEQANCELDGKLQAREQEMLVLRLMHKRDSTWYKNDIGETDAALQDAKDANGRIKWTQASNRRPSSQLSSIADRSLNDSARFS